MKAILHIHTTYSFDGKVSMEEIAREAGKKGIDAVFLSEHLQGLSRTAYGELCDRARGLSGDGFDIIPGIEVSAEEGCDILALGARDLLRAVKISSLCDEIHEMGGLAVMAHPEAAGRIAPPAFSALDGIEVWNGLHDSKYFPNGLSLEILRRARSCNKDIFGCCGLDLHSMTGWFPLTLDMEAARGKDPVVALKSGAFRYGRRNLRYRADWVPGVLERAALTTLTLSYKALSSGMKLTGLSIPPAVSGVIRRCAGNKGSPSKKNHSGN